MKLNLILILIFCIACNSSETSNEINYSKTQNDQIVCTENLCYGIYTGNEFVNGSDIAHQYSNKMSKAVGIKLKELYDAKKYSKVDFSMIEMTTKGMGSGIVNYALKIPFIRVKSKCNSYTSFDHVGGWNHIPELNKRKKQLMNVLLNGDTLNISELKKTPEGLHEYWIQWRNKDKQKECLN